ncbi:MAG: hypothetical protein AAB638_01675, partial [Patescibacteria group bacterium]
MRKIIKAERCFEFVDCFFVIRSLLGYQIPEGLRMIEFFEVAEFVDDYVVREVGWEQYKLVTE